MNSSGKALTSVQRILLMIKRYYTLKQKMILIGLAVLIGVIISFKLLDLLTIDTEHVNDIVYFTICLFVIKYMGYAFSSTMFSEINSKGTAAQYYTLPASTFEKYISAWIVSFLGFTFVAVLLIYVNSLLLHPPLNDLNTVEIFRQIWIYLIAQSIYFFGAAYFKSNNFLSTAVAIIIFSTVLALIIYCFGHYAKNTFDAFMSFMKSSTAFLGKEGESMFLISRTIMVFGIVGLFNWMTFHQLKRREISS